MASAPAAAAGVGMVSALAAVAALVWAEPESAAGGDEGQVAAGGGPVAAVGAGLAWRRTSTPACRIAGRGADPAGIAAPASPWGCTSRAQTAGASARPPSRRWTPPPRAGAAAAAASSRRRPRDQIKAARGRRPSRAPSRSSSCCQRGTVLFPASDIPSSRRRRRAAARNFINFSSSFNKKRPHHQCPPRAGRGRPWLTSYFLSLQQQLYR